MPIYAYKCESCGFAKDVLQKMSDAPLTDCPKCGVASFKKQLTAAGFQLKGSGWYVTDFRGGDNSGAAKSSEPAAGQSAGDSKSSTAGASESSSTSSAPAATPTPAAPAASAAAKPPGGSTPAKSS